MTTNKVPFKSIPTQYKHKLPPPDRGGLLYKLLRPRYLEMVFRRAKKRYAYSIVVASANSKSSLPDPVRSGLRRYAVAFARIKTIEEAVIDPLFAVGGVIVLIGLLAVGFQLANDMNVPSPFFVAIIGDMAAVGLIFAIPLLVPRLIESAATFLVAIGMYCGAVYILDPSLKRPWYSIVHPTSAKTERVVAYGMLMGASLIMFIIVLALSASIIQAYTVGRLQRQYANVTILNHLIRARRVLAVSSVYMSDPSFKSYVVNVLEKAAKAVEDDLPRSISLSHSYIQSEFQLRCSQSAAALRLMQMRLAMSQDSTLSELRVELNEFISAVATGDYGLMPASELPDVSRVRKFVTIIKHLVVAVIPLVTLVAARYLGVQFPANFGNWIVLVALIWAVVSVISLLDPLYKSKVSDIRDVISVVRGKEL